MATPTRNQVVLTGSWVRIPPLPPKSPVNSTVSVHKEVFSYERLAATSVMEAAAFSRLYVNSWGRDKKQIIVRRVGVKAPARFSCTAEEDSVSEITEVTYPEADPLQDFGLVVAALNKAI